ncbi:MAG: hypothetical protein M1833_001014 [Piccolia ochrophora]|nr:MAG: hypothetical protein M1833_001014 [Piccolia ochrophora]
MATVESKPEPAGAARFSTAEIPSYDFQSTVHLRVAKGWERAPRPSFARRRFKRHIIWKRTSSRRKADGSLQGHRGDDEGLKTTKRRCLSVPQTEEEAQWEHEPQSPSKLALERISEEQELEDELGSMVLMHEEGSTACDSTASSPGRRTAVSICTSSTRSSPTKQLEAVASSSDDMHEEAAQEEAEDDWLDRLLLVPLTPQSTVKRKHVEVDDVAPELSEPCASPCTLAEKATSTPENAPKVVKETPNATEIPVISSISTMTAGDEEPKQEVDEPLPTQFIPTSSVAAPSEQVKKYVDDDANMLRDFLNRVNAGKAAKLAKSVDTSGTTNGTPSKQRMALGDLDRNSPSLHPPSAVSSPTKGENDLGSSHSAPTMTSDAPPQDDSKTCRRSKRTRAAASKPEKTPHEVSSCIPVRRPNGTEPVVLPKSDAQELAALTKANTRRNKTQVAPKAKVAKAATIETPKRVTRSTTRKNVSWDEQLVYFDPGAEHKTLKDAKSPSKTRQRLNGTPAPKRRLRSQA